MRRHRRLMMDTPELNLVPLLDMVSLLIQLLLINAQFGVLAEIGTALGVPSTARPGGVAFQVHVTPGGLFAEWQDGGLQSRGFPCASNACGSIDEYDWGGARALAIELDQQFPDEQTVQVRLEPEVPFEIAARVMDALRGPGGDAFPDVVLGGP